MTLKTNYNAGDALPAADVNAMNTAINSILRMAGCGDGSGGALNVTSGTTTIDCGGKSLVVKNYTSFNVSAGATLAFSNVPAAGLLFIPLVQGNYTMAGTIALDYLGSSGAASITQTGTGSQNGAAGTEPYNNAGQARAGRGGASYTYGTYQQILSTTGGGSGASPFNDGGTAPSVVNNQTYAGGAKGVSLTLSLVALLAQMRGYTIAPGAGGGIGGAQCGSWGSVTGTLSATVGAAGNGGGSMMAIVGGNFSSTGVYNMRGQDAAASSYGNGTTSTGTNNGYFKMAGGSAGGAGGSFLAFVGQGATVTNSATYNVGGGNYSSGVLDYGGHGTGNATLTCAVGDGAGGATGATNIVIIPM